MEEKRNSPEEVVDDMLDWIHYNLQQHPDFYAFLFEIWYASRRSKKIRNEFEICVKKAASAIEKLLEDDGEQHNKIQS